VSVRIRLLRAVSGDFPFGHTTVADVGEYDAEMNPHGALSVIANDGKILGIKPGEFEFIGEIPRQWRVSAGDTQK
jgi:hypothetical protein